MNALLEQADEIMRLRCGPKPLAKGSPRPMAIGAAWRQYRVGVPPAESGPLHGALLQQQPVHWTCAPAIDTLATQEIRVKDQIQLRTPDGRVCDTQIAGIEFAHGTKQDASKISRMAIILPRNIPKEDVPSGTEVWVL
jgi:hypothetical protein